MNPARAFGHELNDNKGYYYLLVLLLVASMAVLRLLDTSRTGRAWRAVREDPLAAASMTIPVSGFTPAARAGGLPCRATWRSAADTALSGGT